MTPTVAWLIGKINMTDSSTKDFSLIGYFFPISTAVCLLFKIFYQDNKFLHLKYISSFSTSICPETSFLFLNFPDLRNLVIYMESRFPCYFLLKMEVICVFYLLLFNTYKFMSGTQHESDLYTFPKT